MVSTELATFGGQQSVPTNDVSSLAFENRGPGAGQTHKGSLGIGARLKFTVWSMAQFGPEMRLFLKIADQTQFLEKYVIKKARRNAQDTGTAEAKA